MKRRLAILAFWTSLLAGTADCAPLTSVADALRLPDESCLKPISFDFTGEVLSENKAYWFFRDSSGGIEIHNRHPVGDPPARGSTVRVCGEMTVRRNGVRFFLADTIERLRTDTMETPTETTATAILGGNTDFRLVRIRGVFSAIIPDEVDVNVCWATLRTPSGKVFITLHGKWNNADTLRPLIDAEVSVSGLAAPVTGLRRNLGHCIFVGDLDTVDVIKRPPADPFSVQTLTSTDFPHRQKVSGTVMAIGPSRVFLKTTVGRIVPVRMISRTPTSLPVAGDIVTATGFATLDPYRIQLSDALIRIDGHDTNQSDCPTPRTIRSLFLTDNGSNKIDSLVDGTVIRIQGTVQSSEQGELRISDGSHAISVEAQSLKSLGLPGSYDGCTISATGLCLVEFDSPQSSTVYPTFKRFLLIPRHTADITVLKTAPWWTPFRLTLLILVLAAILLGSTAWNFMLKRKSERRGKELYEEKIDHALAEQKVEERTRLAVELHDSVSQTLTGIALQLDGGEIETAKTMLASCRGELRRCLWDLRSRTFEEKDMAEAVTRTITPHLNGCAATVRFNVPRERLSESLTHAILRIVRELVVNAIRHGQAKHVKIAGEMHENTGSFSVPDDGCGFVPETVPGPEQGHFGLLGIRERIEDFNGTLNIVSVPDHGAKFTVTLTTTADDTNEH